MRTGLRLSATAARWAAGFYARHFWLVFGLSLVPAGQRYVAIQHGDDLPVALQIGGEIVSGLARLLLIYLILRLAVREVGLSDLTPAESWRRLAAGLGEHARDLWFQLVVLAVAFIVLDILPTVAIDRWVPDHRQDLVTAVFVSVKNPTVIAFTFLWMVGVARTLTVRQRGAATTRVSASST
ncbi:hypothetical protein O7627_13685 [Solwaraspora sp. WMMD1047]|uniref:hypothetical protein n=1 Tax=Solwaraspora sp. WMMD1047 TaxID=3016102 RepID=UPI002417EE9B|nr:hypothetical protein [Solwaraspora sp. WMMD1047]MDG4830351.1 hypothetical protein [Solwaraspora sp. WMMD1047]